MLQDEAGGSCEQQWARWGVASMNSPPGSINPRVLYRILPFTFEGQMVRIMDCSGAPWFIAVDVCRILGVGNSSMAL